MLVAVMPLFAATAFHPLWWETLLAAMVGAACGQLAARATRGHRVAAWSVVVVAAIVVAVSGSWSFIHPAPHEDSPNGFLVVRSTGPGSSSLTWDDVREIKTRIPSIDLAVPYMRKPMQLIHADNNWQTQVVGTTPDFFDLRKLRVAAGDRFDASTPAARVVVLGDTVVAQLFGTSANPVGEAIRIDNAPFTIIGVLVHQGTSPQGQDLDDVAIVPIEAFASRIHASLGFGGAVLISATSIGELSRVETELRSLLRVRHRLKPGDDDDFIIREPNP
jgi:putative ABC transport system permease protein